MAANDYLYTDLDYTSKFPGDQGAFIAPMQDERTLDDLPEPGGARTIHMTTETIWDRPVRNMVDDVFRREVANSGVFESIFDKAKREGLVVQPSMVTLYGAHEESMDGARGLAKVGLRVKVYGEDTGNGKRALLFDERFEGAQATGISHRPSPTPVLIGRALQQAIYGALDGLDSSSIGRGGVPIIEASAGRR